MNINELLFIMQLLAVTAISGLKIYNLMHKGALYKIDKGVMLFVGYVAAWGIGLVIAILNYDFVIYATLHQLESWFLIMQALFLFFEVIFHLEEKAKETANNPIKSNQFVRNPNIQRFHI